MERHEPLGPDDSPPSMPGWTGMRGLDEAIETGAIKTPRELAHTIRFYDKEAARSKDALLARALIYSEAESTGPKGRSLARHLCQELDPHHIYTADALMKHVFGDDQQYYTTSQQCRGLYRVARDMHLNLVNDLAGEMMESLVRHAWEAGRIKDEKGLEREVVGTEKPSFELHEESAKMLHFYSRYCRTGELQLMAGQLYQKYTHALLSEAKAPRVPRPPQTEDSRGGIRGFIRRCEERIVSVIGRLFSDAFNE